MIFLRRLVGAALAAALLCVGPLAHAAPPPPVPPIVDADRYQSYNIASSTPSVQVAFPVFGDCTDLIVQVNGTPLVLNTDFTCASTGGGSNLSILPLPITDLVVTFTTPLTSGFLEVIGKWHPRAVVQPTAPGIGRREFNQTVSTIIAAQREFYHFENTYGANFPFINGVTPLQDFNPGGVFYDANGVPGQLLLTTGQIIVGQTSGIPLAETVGGDATLAANGTFTLATVNTNTGSFGDGTHVAQVTLDGKGRATAATQVVITHAANDLTAANNLLDLASASSARGNLGLPITGVLGDFATVKADGTYHDSGVAPGNLASQNAGTGLANSGSNLNLQPAQAATIGGVESIAATTHQYVAYIDTSGVPHQTQPALADISGTGTAAGDNTGTSGATIPLNNGGFTQSGTANFTGTFEIATTPETFPSSGNLVGTTDTQTLTNKTFDTASNTFKLNGSQVVGIGSTLNISTSTLGCTTATASQIGCVEPDGTTITISGGKITAVGSSATAITIGTTSIVGGTNNDCLAQASSLLSNIACASLTGANSYSGKNSFAQLNVKVRTASSTSDPITTADYLVCADNASAAATETLPASPATGDTYLVKDCGGAATTNPITVVPSSGNIDGAGTSVISVNYGSEAVTYTGSQWSVN